MMDYREFDGRELQELVFMVRSKKEMARYLGISRSELDQLFTSNGLLMPTDYLRELPASLREAKLAEFGSTKRMGDYYGVSDSFLRSLLPCGVPKTDLDWDEETLRDAIIKYGSVRLAARCTGTTESQIRRRAKDLGVELAPLLDYATGDNANAKGRRAELEWKELRAKEGVTVGDMNTEAGSQAAYDFNDPILGKVNVKSSRCHKYVARTRADNPWYWKFSTRGAEAADAFVLMFYDREMQNLVGWAVMDPASITPGAATIVRQRQDIEQVVPKTPT